MFADVGITADKSIGGNAQTADTGWRDLLRKKNLQNTGEHLFQRIICEGLKNNLFILSQIGEDTVCKNIAGLSSAGSAPYIGKRGG